MVLLLLLLLLLLDLLLQLLLLPNFTSRGSINKAHNGSGKNWIGSETARIK